MMLGVWQDFEAYFESVADRSILPGNPSAATDYLSPDFAAIDFPTCAAFLTHWAAGAQGLLASVPSANTAKVRWAYFKMYYAFRRGQPVCKDFSTDVVRYIMSDLVDAGLVTKERRVRRMTDGDGLKALATTVLSESFPGNDTRTAIQYLFWQALTISTGVRIGSCFYDVANPDTGAATMTYGNFSLHVRRGMTGRNELSLTFANFHTKTHTNERDTHVITSAPELWRDAVFLFCVLATMDDALPMPLAELLNPDTLGSKPRLDIKAPSARATLAICRPTINNTRSKRDSWSSHTVRMLLGRISLMSGFGEALTPHSLRRMTAVYMRASGERNHSYPECAARLTSSRHVLGPNRTQARSSFFILGHR